MPGSNQRPPACKAGALPTELTALGADDYGGCGRARSRRSGPAPGAFACVDSHDAAPRHRVPPREGADHQLAHALRARRDPQAGRARARGVRLRQLRGLTRQPLQVSRRATSRRHRPPATPSSSPPTSSGSRRRTRSSWSCRCSRRSSTWRPSTSGSRAVTRLYAPPFRTLAQVHDKGTFQELCDRLEIRTPRTVLAHNPEELDGGDREVPRLLRPGRLLARGGRPAHQHRPARRTSLARATASRPRPIPGSSRSSSAGRCTAPTPAFTRGRSPRTCPTGRPGSGSTRRASSSSRSTRATRCRPSSGSARTSGWEGQMSLDFIETERRPGDDRVQSATDRRRSC